MNRPQPPALATWFMSTLLRGPSAEALIGDLIEQYGRGRSSAWYWRQAGVLCRLRPRQRGLLVTVFLVTQVGPYLLWFSLFTFVAVPFSILAGSRRRSRLT